ncbi:MAG: hypothetical protein AVDCRST_MAG40-1775, partial [uncultured Gemmatimonadaceae bacterium]
VRGLLPDEVLASRSARTGTTSDYLTRSMAGGFRTLAERHLATPLLAELGVVNPKRLRRSISLLDEPVQLWYILHTELWLGSHLERSPTSPVQLATTSSGVPTAAV